MTKRANRFAGFVGALSLAFASAVLADSPDRLYEYYCPAYIAQDAITGEVVQNNDPDKVHYSASLTKLMTAIIIFEEIRAGNLSFWESIEISEYAASRIGRRHNIFEGKEGVRVPVHTALAFLLSASSNNIAVAFAEKISGTEEAFVERMLRTADKIGLGDEIEARNLTFRNASGLPVPQHRTGNLGRTSARSMLTIARYLRETYPEAIYFASQERLEYGDEIQIHTAHDLLKKEEEIWGAKTGWAYRARMNLVFFSEGTTGVVLRCGSKKARDEWVSDLINMEKQREQENPKINVYDLF